MSFLSTNERNRFILANLRLLDVLPDWQFGEAHPEALSTLVVLAYHPEASCPSLSSTVNPNLYFTALALLLQDRGIWKNALQVPTSPTEISLLHFVIVDEAKLLQALLLSLPVNLRTPATALILKFEFFAFFGLQPPATFPFGSPSPSPLSASPSISPSSTPIPVNTRIPLVPATVASTIKPRQRVPTILNAAAAAAGGGLEAILEAIATDKDPSKSAAASLVKRKRPSVSPPPSPYRKRRIARELTIRSPSPGKEHLSEKKEQLPRRIRSDDETEEEGWSVSSEDMFTFSPDKKRKRGLMTKAQRGSALYSLLQGCRHFNPDRDKSYQMYLLRPNETDPPRETDLLFFQELRNQGILTRKPLEPALEKEIGQVYCITKDSSVVVPLWKGRGKNPKQSISSALSRAFSHCHSNCLPITGST